MKIHFKRKQKKRFTLYLCDIVRASSHRQLSVCWGDQVAGRDWIGVAWIHLSQQFNDKNHLPSDWYEPGTPNILFLTSALTGSWPDVWVAGPEPTDAAPHHSCRERAERVVCSMPDTSLMFEEITGSQPPARLVPIIYFNPVLFTITAWKVFYFEKAFFSNCLFYLRHLTPASYQKHYAHKQQKFVRNKHLWRATLQRAKGQIMRRKKSLRPKKYQESYLEYGDIDAPSPLWITCW